jgi:hypothetical protein
VAGTSCLGLNDSEFIVAETRQAIGLCHQNEQPFGNAAEQSIALRFAARLVDRAKAIDVDDVNRKLASRPGVGLAVAGDGLPQNSPIGKSGECVGRSAERGCDPVRFAASATTG